MKKLRCAIYTRKSTDEGLDQSFNSLDAQREIATQERAFVQVKSAATPAVLDKYIDCFRTHAGVDRMVFACHSPSRALERRCAGAPERVDLRFADTLAQKAVRAGLFDWLIERAH